MTKIEKSAEQSLYSQANYDAAAHRILVGFEGVCDDEEIRLVLGKRLRAAVEEFCRTQAGERWLNVIDLMAALQSVRSRELKR